MKAFITKKQVKEMARIYFDRILKFLQEPKIGPLKEASVGEPMLVRDETRSPFYWLVPCHHEEKVLGYMEIGLDGNFMGHGYFYNEPTDLTPCPSVVTRLTSKEAQKHAQKLLEEYKGYKIESPVYIYDRMRDKQVWMFEVQQDVGSVVSRIFVTPGFVYERKAGEKSPSPGMRGKKR